MRSLQEKLEQIGTALAEAVPDITHHYFRPHNYPYCVWQEDSEESSFYADLREREQAIHGTVDYYTKTEFDANLDKVQEVLNEIMTTWRLNSVQYEEDLKLIHYEWEWTVTTVG